MARSYRAEDGAPVLQWEIDIWAPDPDEFLPDNETPNPNFGLPLFGGAIVEVREKGDVLSIKPSASSEIRMTKEVAIVLAEDLIINYGAEVGPIGRQP